MASTTSVPTQAQGVRIEVSDNFQPLANILSQELPRFGEIRGVRRALHVLDSSALWNTTFTSLKNLPYIAELGGSGVTARLRYLEAGMMSAASLVCNVALGLIFTVLAAVTFGQVDAINDSFKKQWTHACLSFGSAVSGFAGAVVPTAGVIVNGTLLAAAGNFVLSADMEGEGIQTIRGIFMRNRETLPAACRAVFTGEEGQQAYNLMVGPALNHINQNIEGVQNRDDLFRLAGEVRDRVTEGMRTAARLEETRRAAAAATNPTGATGASRAAPEGAIPASVIRDAVNEAAARQNRTTGSTASID